MLGMLLQPHPVALGDASQRFCVIFQPHCNLAVSDPAQDGRRGQLMRHNEEAGDATGCAARILTASGDLGAADACNRRALGRAIPLAGRGEGWSAPQLPLAHLTKSPRSLLVPVGDFISRTRSLPWSKPAPIGTRSGSRQEHPRGDTDSRPAWRQDLRRMAVSGLFLLPPARGAPY